MIPVSFGVALSMFTMCAVLVYFLNYSKSNFCWPPLWFELYSQGPKSLVAHSIFYGFFSGACRCIFIHKSASYTEAHRDSGLSLMITALSSLATKEEEMGWVFFPFPLFSFLFSIYECHGVDYLILFMSAPEWVWFWLEAAFLPFSRSFYKMLCLEQDSIGPHQVFSQG